MGLNKKFTFGPIALTSTLTTNILNPCTAAGGVNAGSSSQYIILNQVTITNKTAGAVTFSLWRGATGANAAGTEIIGTAQSVAANSSFTYYVPIRLDAADFLVGGASANTSLTISGFGEVGVAG